MNTQNIREKEAENPENKGKDEKISLNQYLHETFPEFEKPLSFLSKPDTEDSPVVNQDEIMLFDFDGICKKIYHKKAPKSADALGVVGKTLIFVEFKKGFQQKLPKNKKNIPCSQGLALDHCLVRVAHQNKKFEEMRDSVKLKAVESYLTYRENLLLPGVEEPNQVHFFLVISLNSLEKLEDEMINLSKSTGTVLSKETEEEKQGKITYKSLRDSLSRFTLCPKEVGGTYLYHHIYVMDGDDFLTELERRLKKSGV